MGHRANFVIIRDGRASAYYDQWAALGSIATFADGPDVAAREASQFEPTDGLMDWAYAEGGYLIDFDTKEAIVFGLTIDPEEFADPDGGVDEQLLEASAPFAEGGLGYLHIALSWTGWKLAWDERGVDAFAAHLRKRSIADVRVEPDSHPPETSPAIEHQA
jgi:hypothetical protein